MVYTGDRVTDGGLMDLDDDNLEQVRAVLRQLLGQVEPAPEPETVNTGNVVKTEGRSTGTPRITPEQHALDFIRRATGAIPAYGAELPEKES